MLDNYIQTARVYHNQNDRDMYIIRCSLCCKEYTLWNQFLKHMKLRHKNLQTRDKSKVENSSKRTILDKADFNEENVANVDDLIDVVDYELNEIKEEVENELANYIDNDEGHMLFKPIHCGSTTEQDNEEKLSRRMTKEPNINSSQVNNVKFTMEHSPNNNGKRSQRLKRYCKGLVNEFHKNSNELSRAKGIRHCHIFYNLARTRPEIMYHFIDLIKREECHWNESHLDYHDIDICKASAVVITNELEDRWQLKTNPKIVRNSILSLIRWFETEYLQHMRDSKYKCKNIDYYRSLLAFLPSNHLRCLICDECQRRFKTESTLLQHKHTAHKAELPYKCRFCDKGYLYKSSLRQHENRHTKSKSWLCQICAYKAPSKSDYHSHLAKHSDERPFVCNLCGSTYKSTTSLAVHRRTHKPPTLKCGYCMKLFREKYRLKRHIQFQHEKGRSCYRCDLCNKLFPSERGFKHHTLRNHTSKDKNDDVNNDNNGDNDTVCSEETSNNMIATLIADCVECSYECRFCQQDFNSENLLIAHIKQMHHKATEGTRIGLE